jgi:hypothetical protein
VIAEIAPALLSDHIARVNITLLKQDLACLDAEAKQADRTRSGFDAYLAIQV